MRYFFHLCDGDTRTLDPDGTELADQATAVARTQADVWKMVGQEVIETGEVRLARHIEIADETGMVIASLPFADAIRVAR